MPHLLKSLDHRLVLLLEVQLLHQLSELLQDRFERGLACFVALKRGESGAIFHLESVFQDTLECFVHEGQVFFDGARSLLLAIICLDLKRRGHGLLGFDHLFHHLLAHSRLFGLQLRFEFCSFALEVRQLVSKLLAEL